MSKKLVLKKDSAGRLLPTVDGEMLCGVSSIEFKANFEQGQITLEFTASEVEVIEVGDAEWPK